MTISRLSASRLTQGLPAFQSMWDQDNVAAGALVPIQSSTLLAASNEFLFSNIPQIYQDLMLVVSYVKTTGTFDPWIALNGDFAANSAGRIQAYANGSTHAGEVRTNDSVAYTPDGGAHVTGYFCTAVINLFDYKSSNRKTILGQVASSRSSTYWTSLFCVSKTIGAVTSISFNGNDGNLVPGSTAVLYGIKAGI